MVNLFVPKWSATPARHDISTLAADRSSSPFVSFCAASKWLSSLFIVVNWWVGER